MTNNERRDEVYECEVKMTNETCCVISSDYEELIIQMVHKIRNQDYLEKIYYYVRAKYLRDEKSR